MPESRSATRPSRGLGWVPVLLLLLAPASARADECDDLARQLKLDALDQLWGAVLEDADRLLECDPRASHSTQAVFYRARALDRLRRRDEALSAYSAFLERHCGRTGSDSILCQDARVSLFSLARDLVAKEGSASKLKILVDGLKAQDVYSRIFAAIQISQLPASAEAKQQALPVLVEAYRLEDDPGFRNEICLAIIRIDPSQCGGGPGTPIPDEPEPTFIKARVFDCKANVEKVSVNLPFSFAKAVIESLGPEVMEEIRDEGFDLENLWESLKGMGSNQVFRMQINQHDRCEEIEVWFE